MKVCQSGQVIRSLFRNVAMTPAAPLLWAARRKACPPRGWVQLVMDGPLVEIDGPRRPGWRQRPNRTTSLYEVQQLVDALLQDPRPAGLVVVLRKLECAPAMRTALRAQLLRVRHAGKRLVVHLPRGGESGELLVALAADRILLGIRSSLGPLGFKVESNYLRRALDRLGIIPETVAQGAFKTAGESFERESMSEAQRTQMSRVLDVLYEELVSALMTGRKLSRELAETWVNDGLFTSEQAYDVSLVDQLIHDDELPRYLDEEPTDVNATLIPAWAYLRRRELKAWEPVRPQRGVAVVRVHGAIVEESLTPWGAMAEERKIVRNLDAAREHKQVSGVVLHVDSPGGGVVASDKIHRAVSRLAEKKPVVACFAGVAASGGYYVAAPCHAIVAQPTTITGSIGVIAMRAAIGPLLEKVGVTAEVIRRGEIADMLSIARPFSTKVRSLLEGQLEESYNDFVALVAQGRRKPLHEVREVAEGRVWVGSDASERGLVDRMGGLDVAIQLVADRLGQPRSKLPAGLFEIDETPWWQRWMPLQALLPQASQLSGHLAGVTQLSSLLLSRPEQVLALWLP